MARKTIRYTLGNGETIEAAQDAIESKFPGVRAVSARRIEGPNTYLLTFSGTGPGMTDLQKEF